jgi:catechol 2,3-dioxygenase-like lactoylglutathione lyase family enzyme
MTAIKGHYAPSRKPGVLGVHSIGEFVLGVPDLAKAQDFYGAFGLNVSTEGESLGLHTQGDGYRWGRVVPSGRKAMQHISLNCFEEDLPRFAVHVDAMGIRRLDPPAGFDSNGVWFRDPDGMLLEIRVGPKTSPDEKAPLRSDPTPAGRRNAPYRRNATREPPRRLSHILRFTADIDRAVAFYSRVLGLRVSDRSADLIAFLHGVHGSDHHVMAFVKSDAPGLHHLSWDVPSLEAIGLGAMAMADKGFSHGWGLGRHVLGSNFFHYVQDPWGSWCEYSADIDYVPVEMDWEEERHPIEDGFYLWGPTPPDDFVINAEAHAKA